MKMSADNQGFLMALTQEKATIANLNDSPLISLITKKMMKICRL